MGVGGTSPRTADDATSTDTESDTFGYSDYDSSASASSCSDEEATGSRRRVGEPANRRHRGRSLSESGPDSNKSSDQEADSDLEGSLQGPCRANIIDIECAAEGGTDWTETESSDDEIDDRSESSYSSINDSGSKLDMRVEVATTIATWYEALRGMSPDILGEDTLKQVRYMQPSVIGMIGGISHMDAAGV